LIAQLVEQGT